MSIIILLLIPAIVAGISYLLNKREITAGEFLIQITVQSLLILCVYQGVKHWQMQDTEVWNGRVTRKAQEKVSCEHSYPCNPHSCNCDDKGDCDTCYDTCYEHDYDFDWNVFDNIGQTFTIARIDDQGTQEPPFWTRVKQGEPTSSPHSYTNYVKNSQYSLFNKGQETAAYPGYPLDFYDYFKLNRLINPDGVIQDTDNWKLDISSVSADLGIKKEVNLILYVVKNKPLEYMDGLNRSWQGAKKNDVVVVINVDGSSITWVNSIAMVKDEYFRVKLRDDLMAIGTLNREKVMSTIRLDIEKHYIRRPMSDFRYLANASKLSIGWFIFALILSVGVSIGTSMVLANNNWRNYNESSAYSYSRSDSFGSRFGYRRRY